MWLSMLFLLLEVRRNSFLDEYTPSLGNLRLLSIYRVHLHPSLSDLNWSLEHLWPYYPLWDFWLRKKESLRNPCTSSRNLTHSVLISVGCVWTLSKWEYLNQCVSDGDYCQGKVSCRGIWRHWRSVQIDGNNCGYNNQTVWSKLICRTSSLAFFSLVFALGFLIHCRCCFILVKQQHKF